MTKEEFGPIEQEIVNEEIMEKPQSKKPQTFRKLPAINKSILLNPIKNLPSHLKKPKLVSILILAGIVSVIYLGLILLSTKPQESNEAQTQTQVQVSPTPQSLQEPSLDTISLEVSSYNQKIDNLDNFQKKLTRPIVNLEITFD